VPRITRDHCEGFIDIRLHDVREDGAERYERNEDDQQYPLCPPRNKVPPAILMHRAGVFVGLARCHVCVHFVFGHSGSSLIWSIRRL
jgi:hypothetical protein